MRRAVISLAAAAALTVGVVVCLWERVGAQDGPPPPPPPPRVEHARKADPEPTTRPLSPLAAGERRVAVTFGGGHDTDGRDGGRPVALIAAALKVPSDVFRQTFTHVRPAAPGSGGPTGAEARKNKQALLAGLSKYGVTNERLDEVSDRYRYDRGRDDLWRHREATAYAVVRGNRVVRFDVADAGTGYTTPPTVTVDGLPDVAVTATLAFGTDLATNGSVASLAVAAPSTRRGR